MGHTWMLQNQVFFIQQGCWCKCNNQNKNGLLSAIWGLIGLHLLHCLCYLLGCLQSALYTFQMFLILLFNPSSLISIPLERRLTDIFILSTASCNMHAQSTAWENGNRLTNFRTMATWISGYLYIFLFHASFIYSIEVAFELFLN